jgi:hypothetical protein
MSNERVAIDTNILLYVLEPVWDFLNEGLRGYFSIRRSIGGKETGGRV